MVRPRSLASLIKPICVAGYECFKDGFIDFITASANMRTDHGHSVLAWFRVLKQFLKATFDDPGREAPPSRVDGRDDSPSTQCSENRNAVSRDHADPHTGLLAHHRISLHDGKPTSLIRDSHLCPMHLLWANGLREKTPVRYSQGMIDIAL
jgi:hypothetical protein